MWNLALIFVIALYVGTGAGLVCFAEAAQPKRRTVSLRGLSLVARIAGAIIFVAGVCLVSTVFTSSVTRAILVRLRANDWFSEVTVTIGTGLLLSFFTFSGALLLGVSGLINRERSARDERKLHRCLDAITIIGWLLIVVGLIVLCLALPILSLIFGVFLVTLWSSILASRRTSQRDGLLWVLAIAAHKKAPLAPAVEEYAAQCRGRYRRWVMELATNLNAGESLPDALDARRRLVPFDVRLAARVGWESGVLGESLRELAVARSQRQPVWREFLGRLLYLSLPILVLQAIAAFLLYFIGPKIRWLFRDFGLELPRNTELICTIGDNVLFNISFPMVFLAEIGILMYLLASYLGWTDWRIPLLHWLFRSADRALLLRTLAVFVDHDRPIVVALRALGDYQPAHWIRLGLARSLEQIVTGKSWSDSLRRFGLISVSDAAVIDAATRVGNLSWALRTLADRGERHGSYRLQVVSQWLFPLVLVLVAAAVTIVVAAFYTPLVKLIQEFSG